jgi:type I restriction-modification system DNA methylase subunit
LAEARATSRATAIAATNHAVHAAPNNHAGLIWAIADLLRGDYKQSEYGRVILPLVLLRPLDCVLEPTKAQVLARAKLLYLVLSKVTEVDLHPDKVSNVEMGYLYEELLRKFSELSANAQSGGRESSTEWSAP